MQCLDPEQSIAWHIEQRVQKHPQRIAIETATGEWTYQQINDTANVIAVNLHEVGIGPGSSVALWLHDAFAETAGVLAIWKAGGAFVPLDSRAPLEFNLAIIATVRPHAIITDSKRRASLPPIQSPPIILCWEELPPSTSTANLSLSIPPDSISRIVFTSGSTGKPKGVEHDQRGMLYRAATSIAGSDFQVEDRQLNLSPLAHVTGSTILLNTFLIGGTLSCYPIHERGIESMGEWIQLKNVTRFATVPTVFRRFMKSRGLLPTMLESLRTIYLGAEPTKWTDVELFRQHCAPHTKLICNIGSTETGPTVRYEVPVGQIGSGEFVPLGFPYPDLELSLLDESGHKVAPGEVGEITIRSRGMALGYFEQPELSAQKFLSFPPDPSLRRYQTGDLARCESSGLLVYAGRKDRQIKINGHRVELDHIATVILKHPDIDEADVTTWSDPARGTRIAAFFTASQASPLTIHTLEQWIRAKLPVYMVPNHLQQLAALPRHNSGKLNRSALPHPPNSQNSPITEAPSTTQEKTILQWWREILDDPLFGPDDNFFNAGGDSLSATRMLIEAEKIIGSKPPINLLFQAPTPRLFARAVDSPPEHLRNLICLQETGSRSPLIFAHGWTQSVFGIQRLAQSIDTNRPVYMLQSNQHCGDKRPPASIEEMITQYADQIQHRLPEGPCLLAGYSLGGFFAFAIATELNRRNYPIEKVIIIDTLPKNLPRLVHLRTMGPDILKRVPQHLQSLFGGKERIDLEFFRQRWGGLKIRFGKGRPTTIPSQKVDAPGPKDDYYTLLSGSLRLRPFSVPVLLIQSDQTHANLSAAWAYLSKNRVERITATGEHTQMLQAPHLAPLRAKVRSALTPPRG